MNAEWTAITILVAILVLFGLRFLIKGPSGSKALGVKGIVAWMDKGRSTPAFEHARYRISAKPDFIVQRGRNHVAIEYKSRRRKVRRSDIVQVIAASLAARGAGWRVEACVVKTGLEVREFPLPANDHDVLALIQDEVFLARSAKRGKALPAAPAPRKCRACAYAQSCQNSLAA